MKLTAIKRKAPSGLVKYLLENNLLTGKILDYGCGRGFDMEFLNCDGYDPYWGPYEIPNEKYDVIICAFVFNIISLEERNVAINIIHDHLNQGGVSYISVEKRFNHGNFKREDHPELQFIKNVGHWELYRMSK